MIFDFKLLNIWLIFCHQDTKKFRRRFRWLRSFLTTENLEEIEKRLKVKTGGCL
jgi:hypothetical protein